MGEEVTVALVVGTGEPRSYKHNREESGGFGVAVGTQVPRSEPAGFSARRVTFEDDGGFAVVGGALPFVEAALLGYAEGGGVIGMNEAHGAGIGKAGVAPGEDGGDGFGGVAFALHGGRENPAGFTKIFDGRNEFAMKMR